MTLQRPEPHTEDERDEIELERSLKHSLKRTEWGFWHEPTRQDIVEITKGEMFALSTTALLAFQHLRGVYNSEPDSPPIHLAVAPHIDNRYREAVSRGVGAERRRRERYDNGIGILMLGSFVLLPISVITCAFLL